MHGRGTSENISQLNTGIYFAILKNESEKITKQFIKK